MSWQQIMIFAALGLSAAVALKMFLPKKQDRNNVSQLTPEESMAYMQAKYLQYAQQQQQLPQAPVGNVQQVPLMISPQIPDIGNGHSVAVSSNFERMAKQEQLDKIPIQDQMGLNGMFPQMTQNTVNPYQDLRNRQQVQMRYPPQTLHNYDRIIRSDGEQVRPSSQPQQVSQHQSGYSQQAGYSTNPYANGSVI